MQNASRMVSILIPMFNSEKYIVQTLSSVRYQSYKNIEVIIVDDGSVDDSYNLASEYIAANELQNFFLIRQVNSGAQFTRNRLLNLANGYYIQFLDADDILSSSKIMAQVNSLKNEPYDTIVFSKWIGFKGDPCFNKSHPNLSIYKTYTNPALFFIDMWSNYEAVLPHSWLISKQLILEAGPWNESLKKNQDGEFFARVGLISRKILFENNGTCLYRLDSNGSISKATTIDTFNSVFLSITLQEQFLLNKVEIQHLKKAYYALAKLYSNFYLEILCSDLDLKDLESATLSCIHNLGYSKPVAFKNSWFFNVSDTLFGAKKTARLIKFFRSIKCILNFKAVKI